MSRLFNTVIWSTAAPTSSCELIFFFVACLILGNFLLLHFQSTAMKKMAKLLWNPSFFCRNYVQACPYYWAGCFWHEILATVTYDRVRLICYSMVHLPCCVELNAAGLFPKDLTIVQIRTQSAYRVTEYVQNGPSFNHDVKHAVAYLWLGVNVGYCDAGCRVNWQAPVRLRPISLSGVFTDSRRTVDWLALALKKEKSKNLRRIHLLLTDHCDGYMQIRESYFWHCTTRKSRSHDNLNSSHPVPRCPNDQDLFHGNSFVLTVRTVHGNRSWPATPCQPP